MPFVFQVHLPYILVAVRGIAGDLRLYSAIDSYSHRGRRFPEPRQLDRLPQPR
jgi:hypothetical protein